jgi:hypothetical protein
MQPGNVNQAGQTVVVADPKRLGQARRNAALGNKICHLLFLISLCERNNARLAIPVDSNLDEVFDLHDGKRCAPPPRRKLHYAFVERSAFKPDSRLGLWLVTHGIRWRTQSVADAARRSREQFELERAFLESGLPPGAVSVRGHFWHYGLMPSQQAFERSAPLRADLRQWLMRRYPDLGEEKSVAVHLRESDFRSHLRHVFKRSILLDDDYYYRAIAAVERELGAGLRYHLFSDNPARVERIFRGKDCVVHRDPAAADWAALYLARNVIQSNSTFCWTACLYNKAFSIQPPGGYNYFQGGGDIPYGFSMPFSRTVAAQPGGMQDTAAERIAKSRPRPEGQL